MSRSQSPHEKVNCSIILSIIIVNYNGQHLLNDCLASVKSHTSNISNEIIVVDNASQDGSSEWLEKYHPMVQLIRSPKNLGFSGGNNLGATQAQGKYILLLNNDTVVRSSFHAMLNLMEMSSTLGALGCQLQYGNGQLQESIGYEHTPLSLALSWSGLGSLFLGASLFRRTVHRTNPIYKRNFAECAWVSGACLMTPRSLWEDLSGLDEKYFMYVEDVDYCKRVRLAGCSVAYTNDVLVSHYEGGGRLWIGQCALFNTVRSYQIYSDKFFSHFLGVIMRLLLSHIFVMRSFYFYLRFLLNLNVTEKDKARAYFLAALRLVMARTTEIL